MALYKKISSTLADIVMQDLETNVLGNFYFHIPVYYRYVDDTIMFILKKNNRRSPNQFQQLP